MAALVRLDGARQFRGTRPPRVTTWAPVRSAVAGGGFAWRAELSADGVASW